MSRFENVIRGTCRSKTLHLKVHEEKGIFFDFLTIYRWALVAAPNERQSRTDGGKKGPGNRYIQRAASNFRFKLSTETLVARNSPHICTNSMTFPHSSMQAPKKDCHHPSSSGQPHFGPMYWIVNLESTPTQSWVPEYKSTITKTGAQCGGHASCMAYIYTAKCKEQRRSTFIPSSSHMCSPVVLKHAVKCAALRYPMPHFLRFIASLPSSSPEYRSDLV